MGAILAKFRKEKTTIEVLEKLDAEIKEIEQYTISTQARQKRYVGNFLVISIGLYIICFVVVYFAFFPPTWMERITYSVPLLIFPLIIFLLKHLVAWFFQRKLNENSVKLSKLKNEKKKVLEKVMDKETYKVALEILNKFGEKSMLPKAQLPIIDVTPNKNSVHSPIQKSLASINQAQQNLIRRPIHNPSQNTPSLMPGQGMTAPGTPLTHLQAIQQRSSPMQMQRSTPMQNQMSFRGSPMQMVQMQLRHRTPFPIVNPSNKGVLDKFVDYLIGDGIQNRFAMICKECYGHNGMALQEEYEYTPFRCIYCQTINPSKKSRPIGPKLPINTSLMSNNMESNDESLKRRRESTDSGKTLSDKYSASESEGENQEKHSENIQQIVNNEVENEEIEGIEKIDQDLDNKTNQINEMEVENVEQQEEEELIKNLDKPYIEKKED